MSSLPIEHQIKQIFFLDKCGFTTEAKKEFYEDCKRYPLVSKHEFQCDSVLGSSGKCNYTLGFLTGTRFKIMEECSLGKAKATKNEIIHEQPVRVVKEISDYCRYMLEGKPFPLWIVIFIIVCVLLVTGFLACLIWNYWVKKRWYPGRAGGASAVESRWTNSPYSSTSAMAGASRAGASRAVASSNAPASSALPSGGPSGTRIRATSGVPSGAGSTAAAPSMQGFGSGKENSRRGIERTIRSLLNRRGPSSTGAGSTVPGAADPAKTSSRSSSRRRRAQQQ